MKQILIGAALVLGLTACGEWRSYVLRNPATGGEVACAAARGQLPPEDVQRLHQCIAACEARGYELVSSGDLPAPVPTLQTAKAPSIPLACKP